MFSSIANGLLSGKYNSETKFTSNDDDRSFMPQFAKDGMERAHELLELLNNLAKKRVQNLHEFLLCGCCVKNLILSQLLEAEKLKGYRKI